jgi:hypothetical protein
MSQDAPFRVVEIRIPGGATRSQVRRICGRVHDLASVVAVEVCDDGSCVRVTGGMTPEEVEAAVAGGDDR